MAMIKGLVWWLGGGSVVAAGVAAYVVVNDRPGTVPNTAPPGEISPVEGPSQDVASAPSPAPAAPEPQAESADIPADPDSTVEIAEAPAPPAFDVVRVARDGAALVAGSAMPGAAINLRVDGAVVAQAMADSAGQFVAIFSLGTSEAAQMMTLEMEDAEGNVTQAVDTVILTPRLPQPPEQLASLAPETADNAPDAPEVAPLPERAPEASAEAPVQAAPGVQAEDPVAETASLSSPEITSVPDVALPAFSDETVSDAPASEDAPLGQDATSDEVEGGDTSPMVSVPEAPVPEAPLEPTSIADAPEAVAEAALDTQTASAPEQPRPAAPVGVETPEVTPEAPVVAQTEAAAPVTETPDAQAQEVPQESAAELPTAFLLRGDGQVEVLDPGPNVMDNVVIDTISYSESGDVQISGRAAGVNPQADLRIYLDNRAIATARAEAGDWRLDLPAIAPGVYTLRVDQLSEGGDVASRFETPFQREDPARVAAAQAQIDAQNDAQAQAEAQEPSVPGGETQIAPPAPDAAQGEGGDAPAVTAAPATTPDEPLAPDAEEPAQIAVLDRSDMTGTGTGAQSSGQTSDESRPAPQGDSRGAAPAATDAQASASAAPPPPAQSTQTRIETAAPPASAGTEPDGAAPDNRTRPVPATAPRVMPTDPQPAARVATDMPSSSPPTTPAPSVSLITVQPGHTLWHISRERYGQGEQYVIIYRANRSQIRDPDLIYPGQIFSLPDR
ncbi:LysM peptidoglycan-binding domain-containing protein [Rhodobacter sp. NTK016B]|uniref:LysM peptidoglycan-binding domain-containing protein n=1 Tax=Rhodobacter sp. NTK016B TaxID=2759676 RepID=UPI001A8F528C|nr:LysM peptidoglycan-binding domain-containing protein [Rhodobacter sp. NTK016B]MBN8291371.1 LysM peptidoglycan-binding domain-containing protein [Rhodobacter sp. NTK016B]